MASNIRIQIGTIGDNLREVAGKLAALSRVDMSELLGDNSDASFGLSLLLLEIKIEVMRASEELASIPDVQEITP